MNANRVIFLDVDGVLNCHSTKQCIPYSHFTGIEDRLVELLAELIKRTGAEIVLSSSWRNGWIPDQWGDQETHGIYLDYKLAQYGIEIADHTPQISGWWRGKEIRQYLDEHPNVAEWVVLDDEYFPDFKDYKIGAHVVRTSNKTGLTKKHIQRAEKILLGENLMDENEQKQMLADSDVEHYGRAL